MTNKCSCITAFSCLILMPMVQHGLSLICPVPPPCNCTTFSGARAYCNGLNLTEIPPLNKSGGTWIIDFSNNKIRSIKANAFRNVQLEQVYFSNNSISHVDDEAFTGSEKSMDVVRLDGNLLRSIPVAVTRLQNLIGLNVQYNPIKTLDEDIMANLSKSLIGISFGSNDMTSWPRSLQRLTNLLMLSVYSLPFREFPDDAFSGFERTLSFLEVLSTKFSNIPLKMNELINLNYITLKENHFLTGLPEEAFRGLNNISTMIFQNNAFQTVPAVFKDSRGMYQVQISSNSLTNITESLYQAKVQPKFSYLTITDTKFTSVPAAISNMPSIVVINLSNGSLKSIRSRDFHDLPALANIVLSFNPITTIDKNAFKNLPSLKYLYLDGTKLYTVPEAITNTNVTWINMKDTSVQCTCTNLAWMKRWSNRLSTKIDGSCANIHMTIQDFIQIDIPKC